MGDRKIEIPWDILKIILSNVKRKYYSTCRLTCKAWRQFLLGLDYEFWISIATPKDFLNILKENKGENRFSSLHISPPFVHLQCGPSNFSDATSNIQLKCFQMVIWPKEEWKVQFDHNGLLDFYAPIHRLEIKKSESRIYVKKDDLYLRIDLYIPNKVWWHSTHRIEVHKKK